jgi:hypothetical protein
MEVQCLYQDWLMKFRENFVLIKILMMYDIMKIFYSLLINIFTLKIFQVC